MYVLHSISVTCHKSDCSFDKRCDVRSDEFTATYLDHCKSLLKKGKNEAIHKAFTLNLVIYLTTLLLRLTLVQLLLSVLKSVDEKLETVFLTLKSKLSVKLLIVLSRFESFVSDRFGNFVNCSLL